MPSWWNNDDPSTEVLIRTCSPFNLAIDRTVQCDIPEYFHVHVTFIAANDSEAMRFPVLECVIEWCGFVVAARTYEFNVIFFWVCTQP